MKEGPGAYRKRTAFAYKPILANRGIIIPCSERDRKQQRD